MSTSPDRSESTHDRIVTLISLWLARHMDDGQLLAALETTETAELGPDEADAVRELVAVLRVRDGAGEVERVARETLEALALAG
jgi:hypothetical protein